MWWMFVIMLIVHKYTEHKQTCNIIYQHVSTKLFKHMMNEIFGSNNHHLLLSFIFHLIPPLTFPTFSSDDSNSLLERSHLLHPVFECSHHFWPLCHCSPYLLLYTNGIISFWHIRPKHTTSLTQFCFFFFWGSSNLHKVNIELRTRLNNNTTYFILQIIYPHFNKPDYSSNKYS